MLSGEPSLAKYNYPNEMPMVSSSKSNIDGMSSPNDLDWRDTFESNDSITFFHGMTNNVSSF